MKKQVKIITTILMIVAVVAMLGNVVLAAGNASGIIKDLSEDNTNVTGAGNVTNLGKTIVGILQVVGIVVAVVVLLVLGIKYMMGSAEEKAEYKKTMIPYLVGALLIFAASTIVNVVYTTFSGISA